MCWGWWAPDSRICFLFSHVSASFFPFPTTQDEEAEDSWVLDDDEEENEALNDGKKARPGVRHELGVVGARDSCSVSLSHVSVLYSSPFPTTQDEEAEDSWVLDDDEEENEALNDGKKARPGVRHELGVVGARDSCSASLSHVSVLYSSPFPTTQDEEADDSWVLDDDEEENEALNDGKKARPVLNERVGSAGGGGRGPVARDSHICASFFPLSHNTRRGSRRVLGR